MNNEGLQRIKEAGLKLTPQRREVYKAMQELRHATVEDIIERVQSRNKEVTVSTIYRILDSFCSANILSFIYHPDTGKCYYDITVAELFMAGQRVAARTYIFLPIYCEVAVVYLLFCTVITKLQSLLERQLNARGFQ